MKLVLALISACVLAGTLAGYLVGRQLTAVPVFETLVSNVSVFQGANDKFAFNYVCNEKVVASYDVDSKQLVSTGLTDPEISELRKQWEQNNRKGLYQRGYDVVVGFVTGGSAIKFARPLLTIVKSREATKYTIPTVIGGLSGFYLGYGIATRQNPSCDSPLAILLARDAKTWKLIEREVANRYFLQVMGKAFFAKDAKPEEAAATAVDRIKKGQIDSQTLLILASIAKYDPPSEPFSWFSFDLILWVYIPVFFLCCGAVGVAVALLDRATHLADVRESKKAKRRASERAAKAAEREARENSEALRAVLKGKDR